MKFRILNIIILLLATLFSQSQVFPEKGVPHIKNFSPPQYLNCGKVWDIGNSPNGLIYMASDNGLIEYDGISWYNFKGSKGITRSILVVNDSLIYSGSDLDFGVWAKSGYNNYKYRSLYPFKDVVQDEFEEFWNIFYINEMVLFVSSQNVYLLKNDQITKINTPIKIRESFIFNDTIYFVDNNSGLYFFNNFSIQQIANFIGDKSFIGMYSQDGKSILVSKNLGLFSFDGSEIKYINSKLSRILKTAKVFSFERIDSTYLAFGTILNGLIITNLNGDIIHIINKVKGLLSNTILSLSYNESGKLWIGMDYGVSSIFLHNNITYIYDYQGGFGTAYAATLVDNEFYFGTNQGLYHSSWNDLNDNAEVPNYSLIPGTEGQVWTLLNYDNRIFIGHDHGLYQFYNNELFEIDHKEGVWSILPYNDFLIAGTYNGISVYKKTNNNWSFYKKMELISGSCNQLVLQDDNILWVNIPNYGVIRAEFDTALNILSRRIFAVDSFASNKLYVFKSQDEIKIITDTLQYVFNSKINNFEISQKRTTFTKPEKVLPGVYHSSTLNDSYAFYPVYNGFAIEYLKSIKKQRLRVLKPIVRNFRAYNNNSEQVVFNGSEVPYKLNNISIEYVVPNHDDVTYQYRLNITDKWSVWTSEHIAEYVGLKYGDYRFELRAKTANIISEPVVLSFTVSKPWSLSWQAYLLYFFIIIIIIEISVLRQKHLLKKEKQRMLLKEQNSIRELTEQYKNNLEQIEQERIKNEFEQLKGQLRSKTVELANKAKESEDKNRLLINIQDKFVEMQKKPTTSNSTLKEIRRLLNSYISVEDRTFEIQMDELHQEFFRNIKLQFPNLSNNDLRLCAYIKVGLNAKEIAEILNIQPSSSYISRSRLRKKLKLKPEEDLYIFLNKL